MIERDLIPQVKRAPGFVKGVWFGDGGSGHGLIVFETEEQAKAANQYIPSLEFDGVRVVGSDTYAIVAEA